MFNGRTLAAAFWANFFALYWLYILDVMELDMKTAVAWLFFFAGAMIVTGAHLDTPQKQKGSNGRKSL